MCWSAQDGHCSRQRLGVPLKLRGVICVDCCLGSTVRDAVPDSGGLRTHYYYSGSLNMSGIYRDRPRWVQACLCSSEIALYNLRNVKAWPAHDGQGRWTVSVRSATHTHTHKDPHPPLSPLPDDPCVSVMLTRGSLVFSHLPSLLECVCVCVFFLYLFW